MTFNYIKHVFWVHCSLLNTHRVYLGLWMLCEIFIVPLGQLKLPLVTM